MKYIILIFILIFLSCHHNKELEFEVDFSIIIRKSTINKSYKFNINSNNTVFELIRDNDNFGNDKMYKYKLVDSQKNYLEKNIIKIIKLYNENPSFAFDSDNNTYDLPVAFIDISIFKDSKLQYTMKFDYLNIHFRELINNLIVYSIETISKNSNKVMIFKTPFLFPPPPTFE